MCDITNNQKKSASNSKENVVNIYKRLLCISVFFFCHPCLFSMDERDFIVYDNYDERSFEERAKKDFTIGDDEKLEDHIKLRDGELRHGFFTPYQPVCKILTRLIDREEESIKISAFFFTEQKIIDALIRAVERGVPVELVASSFVVLGQYDLGARALEKAGAKVSEYSPPKKSSKWARGVLHSKYIIFGKNIYKKSLIVTGSLNLTYSAHTFNKENIYLNSVQKIVRAYNVQFAYLRDKCSYDYKSVEKLVPLVNDEVRKALRVYKSLFSPDDDMFRTLIAMIHEEKESIKITAFFLTEGDVVDALESAIKRGINVELVVNSPVVDGHYNRSAKILYQKGASIFKYEQKKPGEEKKSQYSYMDGVMHNKFILFGKNVYDKALLWNGSPNITASARNFNKESVTIYDDERLVIPFNDQFDYLRDELCTPWEYVKPPRSRGRKKKTTSADNAKKQALWAVVAGAAIKDKTDKEDKDKVVESRSSRKRKRELFEENSSKRITHSAKRRKINYQE